MSSIKLLIEVKKSGIFLINSFNWEINSGTIKANIKIIKKIKIK